MDHARILTMKPIKDYEWHFELNEAPVAKGRPRFTSRGRAYTPKKTMKYEEDIVDALADQMPSETIEGPIAVRLIFFLEKPKTASREYPSVRPDLDNFAKAILDAAQKAKIFKDDGQVCDLVLFKRYAIDCEPGVVMSVEKLD